MHTYYNTISWPSPSNQSFIGKLPGVGDHRVSPNDERGHGQQKISCMTLIGVYEMHVMHRTMACMLYNNIITIKFIIIGETLSCNLKQSLVCALRGQVSSTWYSFGLAIGVPKQVLNQLNYHSDEECLTEVLDYWLKHHPGKPTWQEIMDAKNRIVSGTAQHNSVP